MQGLFSCNQDLDIFRIIKFTHKNLPAWNMILIGKAFKRWIFYLFYLFQGEEAKILGFAFFVIFGYYWYTTLHPPELKTLE